MFALFIVQTVTLKRYRPLEPAKMFTLGIMDTYNLKFSVSWNFLFDIMAGVSLFKIKTALLNFNSRGQLSRRKKKQMNYWFIMYTF